jgi:hypothetical protein
MAVRPRTNGGKALRLACRNADGFRGRKLKLEQFLSELGVDICLLNEKHLELVRALRFANYLPPDGPTDSAWRHTDPCPLGYRSLYSASLVSAAPGGYCHTPSVGDQTSKSRGGLPLAHTTLDRVPERRIPHLNGG